MTEPTVTRADGCYEIHVDSARAGLAAYRDIGGATGTRIFYDTRIDDEFGGRGLGTKLVAAALADTRATGKRIVPVCSFVAAYVDRHGEYADVVDPVTPEALALVDGLG